MDHIMRQAGPLVRIGAMSAQSEDGSYPDGAYEQTKCILDKQLKMLSEAGGSIEDVIGVRMFVSKAYDRKEGRRAYSEKFLEIKPTYTVLTVDGFADDRQLLTCELTAVVGCAAGKEYEGVSLKRENFSSGAPFENIAGYSRMVKSGPVVIVGGTTSVQPDGSLAAPGVSDAQEEYILNKELTFLEKAGARASDIVRITKFITPDFKKKYEASSDKYKLIKKSADYKETDYPVGYLSRDQQLEEIEMTAVIRDAAGNAPKWALDPLVLDV